MCVLGLLLEYFHKRNPQGSQFHYEIEVSLFTLLFITQKHTHAFDPYQDQGLQKEKQLD